MVPRSRADNVCVADTRRARYGRGLGVLYSTSSHGATTKRARFICQLPLPGSQNLVIPRRSIETSPNIGMSHSVCATDRCTG